MRVLAPRLILAVLVSVAVLRYGYAADNKPTLDELIARARAVTREQSGIDEGGQDLARQIQSFGAAAVPQMMELLESEKPAVRVFAGYVVRDLDGLDESHLDRLIAARRRGDGWIPPAIGRIGTPRAIAFLLEDIRRAPEAQTQVTWGLSRAGEKAAPALAEVFTDRAMVVPDALASVIGHIFSEMGAKASVAVPRLIEVATDRRMPAKNRVGAIYALGAIGRGAAEAVPVLQELARTELVY